MFERDLKHLPSPKKIVRSKYDSTMIWNDKSTEKQSNLKASIIKEEQTMTSEQMLQVIQPMCEGKTSRKNLGYSFVKGNQPGLESNVNIHEFLIDTQKPLTKVQLKQLFPNQHIIRIDTAYDCINGKTNTVSRVRIRTHKDDDKVSKIKQGLTTRGYEFSDPTPVECGKHENFIQTHAVKWHDPKVEISQKLYRADKKPKEIKPRAPKEIKDKENSYRKSVYDWNKLKKGTRKATAKAS